MNTAIRVVPKIKNVSIDNNVITALLWDGIAISVPLEWSWRLAEATPEQRERYTIIGDGHGIHWPEIDEDISAEGMLYGSPAPRPIKQRTHIIPKKYNENETIAPGYI
ncbi:hypothetical protein MHK_007893 [Candidatus Magnetomorum sp. HK-1]|nr:hypothetical protein MHK_007893 [Candidatus Magnetomorum sp. HK-1]